MSTLDHLETKLQTPFKFKKKWKYGKTARQKEKCFKIPCGNNDHISLFCSPLNYTRKKNLQSVYPCFLFSNDCFCGIPRSILPLSKGYLYHFNVSPLSNATCCTYKHGLVNVTRNVSLSSVPANDLLSCEQKKNEKWIRLIIFPSNRDRTFKSYSCNHSTKSDPLYILVNRRSNWRLHLLIFHLQMRLLANSRGSDLFWSPWRVIENNSGA